MATIVYRTAGTSGGILRHRYSSWDALRGEVTTEVWGCLYSELTTVYAALKAAGAQTIVPSPDGPTCVLTATFGAVTGSAGEGGEGGGTGGVTPITVRWSSRKGTVEIDLARIRTWGIEGDPTTADNVDRAEKLNKIDNLIAQGKLDVVLASSTLTAPFKKYASLKAAGYSGAMRANYTITKTTTWANRGDIDAYLTYDNQWKVTGFAAIGSPIKEPKFRDVSTNGTWALVPFEWLWMPPDSDVIDRSWTLVEEWLGAYKWKGELYEGGTG